MVKLLRLPPFVQPGCTFIYLLRPLSGIGRERRPGRNQTCDHGPICKCKVKSTWDNTKALPFPSNARRLLTWKLPPRRVDGESGRLYDVGKRKIRDFTAKRRQPLQWWIPLRSHEPRVAKRESQDDLLGSKAAEEALSVRDGPYRLLFEEKPTADVGERRRIVSLPRGQRSSS